MLDIETIIIIVLAVAFIVLVCVGLTIANGAGDRFYQKYKEFDEIESKSQISALGFFQFVNREFFDGKLQLGQAVKDGQDAYARGILFLSERTMNSSSLASLSIVAHELGHAKQDFTTKKLKRMTALRQIGRMVGYLLFPCLVAAIVMFILNYTYLGFGFAGGVFFIVLLAVIIKAAVIRIEDEASKNAEGFLEQILDKHEIKQCKKFLKGAKLTYWADMFRVLLSWTFLTRKGKLFR